MRKKRILNKKVLKNSILKVFQEYPFKKFNYKQVSKQINFKKLGEKILVYEALNELKSSGLLNEPKREFFAFNNRTEKIINKQFNRFVEKELKKMKL